MIGAIIITFEWDTKKNEMCHCYRDSDEVIRIISARKATKKESQQYYQQEMR